MRNKTSTWIFFFLFVLTASGVFAAMVENSHQGLPAISVTSHPAFNLENPEQHQGLTCVLLNLVSVGAFTSKDPIGFNGGNNLYRYADNNPIIYTDPTGEMPWLAWLMVGKGATAGIYVAAWFYAYDSLCEGLCPGTARVKPFPAPMQAIGMTYSLMQYKPENECEKKSLENEASAINGTFFSGEGCFYKILLPGVTVPFTVDN